VAFIHHFDLLLLAHSKPLLNVKLTMTYTQPMLLWYFYFITFYFTVPPSRVVPDIEIDFMADDCRKFQVCGLKAGWTICP